MKKFMIALTALLTLSVSVNAMSYEQAREQALFLTDKMAYELNLTDDQYEAAYEVNLDYLMGINDYNDLYGAYWTQRNLDLSYILLDWQYRAYCAASYFYRPLYWDSGYWHFGIYARYPHRDYYFFGRPTFVTVYRGGHSWRMNNGRSWYHGRHFGSAYSNGERRIGMRDGFNRGDYGRGTRSFGSLSNGSRSSFGEQRNMQTRNSNRSFGSSNSGGFGRSNGVLRESRTRATVRNGNAGPFGGHGSSTFGSGSTSRSFNPASNTAPNRTFSPRGSSSDRSFSPSQSSAPSTRSSSFGSSRRSSSFGGSSSNRSSFGSASSRSMGSSRGGFGRGSFGGGSSSRGSNGGGSFGGHR